MSFSGPAVEHLPITRFGLWDKLEQKRALAGFHVEITARCNNDCRHCYINRPAGDAAARARELTLAELDRLGGEAAALGALSCIVGGGEPLLRRDFPDIFLALKRRGLLVSVFTNACLVTPEHVALFKRYPPREIEVTVYGVTRDTYERVSRAPGSFDAFMRGLDLLLENRIPVRLKAMALRSNRHELDEMARFCRARTRDYFRFDPFLHYRFDRDPARNREIEAERLDADEVVALELGDAERVAAMQKKFDRVIRDAYEPPATDRLFRCGVGQGSVDIGSDGTIRPCLSLWHPDFVYDWRRGTLADAWENVFPRLVNRASARPAYLARCQRCRVVNLCMWCPANAYLETGELDCPVDFFCRLAYARQAALQKARNAPLTGGTPRGTINAKSEPMRSESEVRR